MMLLCRYIVFSWPLQRNVWGLILGLFLAAGCQQNAASTGPTAPWQRNQMASATAQQQQLNQLAEAQRKQMANLSELQHQNEEYARLAQQQQLDQRQQEADRQALLNQQHSQQLGQYDELRRRADELDANNRDLHSRLARSQQQSRLLEDQVKALQGRLNETAGRLSTSLRAKQDADEQLTALQASMRRRGGAAITANNSLQDNLTAISIPGIEVRQDGDVVRMELPADNLFVSQTASLNPAAVPLINQVAEAIGSHYPRQLIGVEAHTDNNPVSGSTWRSSHQLSVAQATAVFEQLTRNPGVTTRQAFILGHGPNHPIVSNGTPAGQARNRRVEIVVYPETIDEQ